MEVQLLQLIINFFLFLQTSHITNIHICNLKRVHIAYIYNIDVITEPYLYPPDNIQFILSITHEYDTPTAAAVSKDFLVNPAEATVKH